ncbi:bacillithiol biosynthesis cysteine-adding enzyme BshC [Chitinophaga rhizosphaerae]|uniref:bacillithiol biosynthesis cysteine-adding enzyme BshC n=1 Tax=Chitinophaga rhizosphaerae TaxID=1864947 RepID=UPI0013E02DA2|nr:bacillithiol biosynthesis cysteine-adding enzyme BshC [Chitinophaga rhizosphaerae]
MIQHINPGISFHTVPIADTRYFSPLIANFLSGQPPLRDFYAYSPTGPDFAMAIKIKEGQALRRDILTETLYQQYAHLGIREEVRANIGLLQATNTFTVCTAHQPNIFTGFLYFAYKILQTVKLAQDLTRQHPGKHFVPVYYMGSEDADLDELGSIWLEGRKLTWETDQTGAVGRMRTENLEPMLKQIGDSIGFLPHGPQLLDILRNAYLEQPNIQQATLSLVNELFGCYGLVVLIPDHPNFKRQLIPVMKDELLNQRSEQIVSKTIDKLSAHFKVQATPREINLFYLIDDKRERIVKDGELWKVLHTQLSFTRDELLNELETHPERFSPNVILRGILQETILPNIAFIGGGGEVAYWLELKDLFQYHKVPYPVILLRNSFLWVRREEHARLHKLGLTPDELFEDTGLIISKFVHDRTNAALVLRDEYTAVEKLFNDLEEKAKQIDVTLAASVNAERSRAIKSIGKIEHKFLRAEKKKFAWQTEQIQTVKDRLFPGNSLQERKENLLPYYAECGPAFFDHILQFCIPVTDQFIIVTEL